MQITSRFTIAIHVLVAVEYFGETEKVTSNFLAGSIGTNPVIVRNVMSSLKEADIIDISKGKTGIGLARDLDRVTFYDVYKAVDYSEERCIFHFHENPNPACPVGANIHGALDEKLIKVQEAMENEMKKITVADVTAGIHRAMCK